MTLEWPQFCKLWFGVSKGVLPVEHLAPTILMAINYCGRQLVRSFGWAAPVYHREVGAIPHPGACTSIACSMTGGLMGVLGCMLGRGILIV